MDNKTEKAVVWGVEKIVEVLEDIRKTLEALTTGIVRLNERVQTLEDELEDEHG